ncbi:MAG: hypothetical protein HRU33_00455 [Rhodobacteraceae bacterium]|nr:hypothetical protein [Paracoccaceae bacterium]
MSKLLKALLSDTWIAHIGRLGAILFGFYSLYSASGDFKIWFDNSFGQNLSVKVLTVLMIFFLGSWLVSLRHNINELLPEIRNLRERDAERMLQIEQFEAQPDAPSIETTFIDSFTEYAGKLIDDRRYAHVLRLRETLSRYLWIEGLLRARVSLGRVAETAAARTGDKSTQIAVLIDDLGWTLAAQGEFAQAKEKIEFGLKLAEQGTQYYWISKAHRHLAGILTMSRDFKEAKEHIKKARNAVEQIEDANQKTEMLGGLSHAEAVTDLFSGNFEGAMAKVKDAENLFLRTGDQARLLRSYAMKGKILLASGGISARTEARSNFLRGLEEARSLGRRDEVVRNLNGLIRLADLEGETSSAQKYREEVAVLIGETPVPFEIVDQV